MSFCSVSYTQKEKKLILSTHLCGDHNKGGMGYANQALISSVTSLTSGTGFLLRLSGAELVVRVRYKIARRPGNAPVTSPLGYFWRTHPTKHKSCGPCGNAAVAVSDTSGG